ncbi:MAG: NUDIX hydrolase [Treponema sp.]|jgi:8-oxo-dGTP pyrophosphatase MutT (NUDIX family)|nr:NUDIX hydrolase [Treponema sp.]
MDNKLNDKIIDKLEWNEESQKTVFTTPIFSVSERYSRSPEKTLKTFTVLDTHDWAIVIPVLETERGREFVMVRQWRHGAREISLEFPGGVFGPDEEPSVGAARELREETGYNAGKIERLGVFNPNPAIMSNRVHFFIALDLSPPLPLKLDEDEYVEVETVPWREVLFGLGKPPYIHALMGTAMSLYFAREEKLQTL